MTDRLPQEPPKAFWCPECGYTDSYGIKASTCYGPHSKRHAPRLMEPLGDGFDRGKAHNE